MACVCPRLQKTCQRCLGSMEFVHARRCRLLREVSRPGATGGRRTTLARYLAAHSRNIESLLCTMSEHRMEPARIRVARGRILGTAQPQGPRGTLLPLRRLLA